MQPSLSKSSQALSLAVAAVASLVMSAHAVASPGRLTQRAFVIDRLENSAQPQPELVKQVRKMYRVIVQYGQRKSAVQERRILRALKGLPYEVVMRFQYSPSIALNVDRRGLERLRAMPGVTVQFDEPVPPT